MKTSVGIRPIVIGLAALAALCNCASAACPSADLNGDCLVNFLDFQLAAGGGGLLDLQILAEQWLEFDDEPPTILGRVDKQAGEPDSFAVELVVVDKQRIERTVFQYECQVILTNLSEGPLEDAQLVMTAWPDNMTIIDPHATFGQVQIAPAQSATSIDTCTFTVDRSILIEPLEIVWSCVAAPQDMTFIPGGTFQMGDNLGDEEELYNDERPIHTVTMDSFYMGRYEVTNQRYCDYLNSALSQGLITVASDTVYKAGSGISYPYCGVSPGSPSYYDYSQIAYSGGLFYVCTKNGREMSNDPMVEVGWYGAAAYCNWRSEQEGKEQCYDMSTWNCDFGKQGYRLATEAEWEYAARGGLSGRRFPWGDTISHSQANYRSYWEQAATRYFYDVSPTEGYHPDWDDGVYPYTSPVGSFPANNYGVYDMAGNAWEWCNDWHDAYSADPQTNPTGPVSGLYRVLRGGDCSDESYYCRSACRNLPPSPISRPKRHAIGFRVVLDF